MKREKIKLEITQDSDIQMLHSDKIDLSAFGKSEIERASHVEFNNKTGKWEVTSAKTKKLLMGNFNNRKEAIDWVPYQLSTGTGTVLTISVTNCSGWRPRNWA